MTVVFERGRTRGTPFKSKIDAFQSRMPIYWCLRCDLPAGKEVAKGARKVMLCSACGSRAQYFASRAEHRRYMHLAMLRNAGEITNLILQPVFPVEINGIRVCCYRADYEYVKGGVTVVEDMKGSKDFQDNASALRRKAAEAYYGFSVKIIEA